jgi:hypothetical protein
LKDGSVDFRLRWGLGSGNSLTSPTSLSPTPAQLKTKGLTDHWNDLSAHQLKDEFGNPRGTQYVTENPNPNGWAIFADLIGLGVGLLDARVDPEVYLDASEKLAEDENATPPDRAYDRMEHFGSTPTRADRAAIGAGPGQVADHYPTLAERWYFGDSSRGEIPGYLMTPSQRAASAADRSRMRVQSRQDSDIQGGQMAAFSKRMKKVYRLGLVKNN